MQKQSSKAHKAPNKKGFTLIEIIVVLVIIGVIATMSISAYFSWIEKSRAVEATAFLKPVNDLMKTCMLVKSWNQCAPEIPFNNQNTPNFSYTSSGGDMLRNRWFIAVCRQNASGDPGSNVHCPGAVDGVSGPKSCILICHNYDGRETDQFVGGGFYSGIY